MFCILSKTSCTSEQSRFQSLAIWEIEETYRCNALDICFNDCPTSKTNFSLSCVFLLPAVRKLRDWFSTRDTSSRNWNFECGAIDALSANDTHDVCKIFNLSLNWSHCEADIELIGDFNVLSKSWIRSKIASRLTWVVVVFVVVVLLLLHVIDVVDDDGGDVVESGCNLTWIGVA